MPRTHFGLLAHEGGRIEACFSDVALEVATIRVPDDALTPEFDPPQTRAVFAEDLEDPPPNRQEQAEERTMKGTARFRDEMELAASLHPCATCGASSGFLRMLEAADHVTMHGVCPSCLMARVFTFAKGARIKDEAGAFGVLAGTEPSSLYTKDELLAELRRCTPLVSREPRTLGRKAWRRSTDALRRAILCVSELEKHRGADAPPAWVATAGEHLRELHRKNLVEAPRIWQLSEDLAPSSELRGLLFQAEPAMPTITSLRSYYESRGAKLVDHERGLHLELAGTAPNRLTRVRLFEDEAKAAVCELRFARATMNDFDSFVKYGPRRDEPTPIPWPDGEAMAVTMVAQGRDLPVTFAHHARVIDYVRIRFPR